MTTFYTASELTRFTVSELRDIYNSMNPPIPARAFASVQLAIEAILALQAFKKAGPIETDEPVYLPEG